MNKDTLIHEEDFIFHVECGDCGGINGDMTYDECEKCGSTNLIVETGHENMECKLCKQPFDMWEDAYIDKTDFDLVCDDCYNDLDNLEG